MHDFSPTHRSLLQIVLTLHFTSAAFWHYFYCQGQLFFGIPIYFEVLLAVFSIQLILLQNGSDVHSSDFYTFDLGQVIALSVAQLVGRGVSMLEFNGQGNEMTAIHVEMLIYYFFPRLD